MFFFCCIDRYFSFFCMFFFFFKQKTAYEISECDWSSDVCSSDLCWDTTPDTDRREPTRRTDGPTGWLADWHQRSRRADDEVRARTRRASAFCHLSRARRTLARARRDWKTDDGARGEEAPTKGRKRQTEERSGARKRKMTTT